MTSLNKEQRQAVEAIDGAVSVLAGAGSGKTKALTTRIANMLDKGISPKSILAITFTNKAAREMKERVAKLVKNPAVAESITISTFHAFCMKLLRQNINYCKYLSEGYSVIDADDAKALIKTAILGMNYDIKKFSPSTAMFYISNKKNNLVWYNEYDEEDISMSTYQEIYKVYQEQLIAYNRCDFDDLLFYAFKMLRDNPDLTERLQDRYKYILIDEYQDTNPAQYALVRLLTQKYRNIFVVGDIDQAIYGFRGSDYTNILNFKEDFPEAKTILLEKNYRSTASILEAANAVIANNQHRIPKNLIATTNERYPIVVHEAETEKHEAFWLYNKINSLKHKYKYQDIAILVRNNTLTKPIEDLFIVKGMPYKVVGSKGFYDRAEIKDSMAYLKIVENPHDMLSLQRIINVPKRGIGDKSVLEFTKYCASNDLGIVEAVEKLESEGNIASVCPMKKGQEGLINFKNALKNFQNALKRPNTDSDTLMNKIANYYNEMGLFKCYSPEFAKPEDRELFENKLNNIQNLVMATNEYKNKEEDKTLENFLDYISLMTDVATDKKNENKITIMTCHASKGLEFPVVFIVAMEENIFPSWQAVNQESFSGSSLGIEEERRLAYVAYTRAKKELFISYAQTRSKGFNTTSNDSSRFIEEIPYHLIEEEYC